MKKYYAKDVKFVCDCCGKEFKELYYEIQNYKLINKDYIFCCKKCLEKFVERYKHKKYPKSKNW